MLTFVNEHIRHVVCWMNSSQGASTTAGSEKHKFFLIHDIRQSNYQPLLGDVKKRLRSGTMCEIICQYFFWLANANESWNVVFAVWICSICCIVFLTFYIFASCRSCLTQLISVYTTWLDDFDHTDELPSNYMWDGRDSGPAFYKHMQLAEQ